MDIQQFVQKWTANQNIEKAAAQEQFIDLCRLFGHPTPNDDPTGENMAFEKGVVKLGGKSGQGWADVWKRHAFAWENKTPGKDLDDALAQLRKYHGSLENVPLLVVSDLKRWRIHSVFTNYPDARYDLALPDLLDPHQLGILRRVFFDPESFRPQQSVQVVTEKVARDLSGVAESMGRRLHPENVARFLDRVVFCLFAEDVGLLPESCFAELCKRQFHNPANWARSVAALWSAMQTGGVYGALDIPHFNGGLFRDIEVLLPTSAELQILRAAAATDWHNVDASIFGTLFERGLNPDKRAQLGAHYTSRLDIEDLLRPVLMAPLRAEWDALQARLEADYEHPTQHEAIARDLEAWADRLAALRVFDPACGSGNFLFIALQSLKDLEALAHNWADVHHLKVRFPGVSPAQCYGLELDVYAHDLAQTTLQIGYLQWFHRNARPFPPQPLLASLSHIERRDAVLDTSDPHDPRESQWPACDVIVGNPPFLGGSKLWREVGRDYQAALWHVYDGRVPGGADLCCYWFEKARAHINAGAARRAGLIATQAIRGGANREVLKRIKASGDIFFAVSDHNWINDGAAVHVSLVGFDNGSQTARTLDGQPVAVIHSDLTGDLDLTTARQLPANDGLCFIGAKKAGDFNLLEADALQLLDAPNPHAKPNSDVLRPWVNGLALTQRPAPQWIVDPNTRTLPDFELYERPHFRVESLVKPARATNNEARTRDSWWLYKRNAPEMRAAIAGLNRYIATPRISKYRLFVWLTPEILPDDGVYIFARDDDYFFGVLHSRVHEVWALRMGTQLEDRPRYTPETCFATFAFPQPDEAQRAAIAEAARNLHQLRENWLYPAAWLREEVAVFAARVDGPWAARVANPDRDGVGQATWTRRVVRDKNLPVATTRFQGGAWHSITDKAEAALSRRTLTNLYNERPSWLARAHETLDAAVLNAYGWPARATDAEILAALLALNAARARAA